MSDAGRPPPSSPTGPPGAPPECQVTWRVERSTGTAASFHARDPGPGVGHALWIHRVTTPALVLGSTQPDELVRHRSAAADGLEVCRRRSGGGLVHLDPRTDCWIDAVVPAGSPLWDDDIGRSFHWLGFRWARVIDAVRAERGPGAMIHRTPGAAVHRGPARRPPGPPPPGLRRPLWCFAEVGHGEVTIGGRKLVGLSQRRTREWARLQVLVLGSWPGAALRRHVDPRVLGVEPDHPWADPASVAAGPPDGLRLPPPDDLAARFLDGLTVVGRSTGPSPGGHRPDTGR